jgi:hypothetical protein
LRDRPRRYLLVSVGTIFRTDTEHVAFSFMKRRVQPLMARDTLGFDYTGDNDTSRMPGDEVDDDDIVDRLARIFKDMPPYRSTPPRAHQRR